MKLNMSTVFKTLKPHILTFKTKHAVQSKHTDENQSIENTSCVTFDRASRRGIPGRKNNKRIFTLRNSSRPKSIIAKNLSSSIQVSRRILFCCNLTGT